MASARASSLSILLTSLLFFGACTPEEPIAQQPSQQEDMAQGSEDMAPPVEDISFPPEDMSQPPRPDMSGTPDMRVDPPQDMSPDMPINTGDYPKAAVIESMGSKDTVLLKGMVLTPSGVIEEGEVLIAATFIRCVGTACSGLPEASGATVIQTHGIISPGLIDSHNHLPYNFLKEWEPPAGVMFTNRYQWADDPSYEEFVRPFTAHRSSNSHFCPGARWGELRSLVHGTTTVMGQSFERTCTRGGVRNADHSHELQYDHMRTSIGSVRDINTEQAMGYIDSFDEVMEPITRFAVHMGEGHAGDNITEEFDSFAGRDPRSIERHQGLSLLYKETAVLIHAMALTTTQLDEVKQTNSKIVWSPSSNMVLYGQTADIDAILGLGIITGIGPDWTLSGEDNLLGEMQFAHAWAKREQSARVTPQKIWEMATGQGAQVVGLHEHIGTLSEGRTADITVFARRSVDQDPYLQVIESRAQDVRLVFIDGQAHYGDTLFKTGLAYREDCEAFDACGAQKFICSAYSNSDEYAGISTVEGLLTDILVGTGYPADEQYGRPQDLLPLVDCTP